MNEDELIKGCVEENVDCQRILYEKYANKMMGVSMRYCNSRFEAEDVLQEAFIKIFNKIGTFEKRGSLEGWIRRIVVFTALKSNDKRVRKFEFSATESMPEVQLNAHVISSIDAKQLIKIIQEIPEGYRAVFNLYAIEGYSHKEIGEELGISEVTSRSQYSRAKNHIKKLLLQRGFTR